MNSTLAVKLAVAIAVLCGAIAAIIGLVQGNFATALLSGAFVVVVVAVVTVILKANEERRHEG